MNACGGGLLHLVLCWRRTVQAAAIGGNAGNLYAYLPGDETLAPILLSAHMDAVAPACAKSLCCTQTDALPQTGRQSSAQTMYPASVQFWKL